jgi:hypothetical protein
VLRVCDFLNQLPVTHWYMARLSGSSTSLISFWPVLGWFLHEVGTLGVLEFGTFFESVASHTLVRGAAVWLAVFWCPTLVLDRFPSGEHAGRLTTTVVTDGSVHNVDGPSSLDCTQL